MPVYVDQPLFRLGRMRTCHMWADDVDDLHAMAGRLGLRRSWFQAPPAASWEHYDVCLSRRATAIASGAVETDRYGALEWAARRSGDHARLASIARVRSLRRAPGAVVHHPGPEAEPRGGDSATQGRPPRTVGRDGAQDRRRPCPT